MRKWGEKHDQLDVLAPAFQRIMGAWMNKFLKASPSANVPLNEQLKTLKQKWTCTCSECTTVRNLPARGAQTSCSMEKTGAPKRKHVEGMLTLHAKGMATFSTIKTTPQGLEVRVARLLSSLARWSDIDIMIGSQVGCAASAHAVEGESGEGQCDS